jgi:hypothetical protein
VSGAIRNSSEHALSVPLPTFLINPGAEGMRREWKFRDVIDLALEYH